MNRFCFSLRRFFVLSLFLANDFPQSAENSSLTGKQELTATSEKLEDEMMDACERGDAMILRAE